MTKNNSFTDKERAALHEDRCHGNQGEAAAGSFSVSDDTCINCGAPLGRKIPEGYAGALCAACD